MSGLRIAILHPELGVGGAERLVIDAALALRDAGHAPAIFTARHDPARSFAETRDARVDVVACAEAWPLSIGGRLRAPCAIARMLRLATVAAASGRFDLVVCDVVSHVIPAVRALLRAPVVFYGHFPDALLAAPRRALGRLYRAPIDAMEGWGLRFASRLLVNSRFTAAAFERTFPRVVRPAPEVLYPGVALPPQAPLADGGERILLSLQRFEPRKNLALAIESFAELRRRLSPDAFGRLRLVVAGALDERLPEQGACLSTLRELAERRALADRIEFAVSPTDEERDRLLRRCFSLLHTAPEEHLGFAPLEAMAAGKPVLAVAGGGPLETVREGETGFLRPPTPAAFAGALEQLLGAPDEARSMGAAGRCHVAQSFSREAFSARFVAVAEEAARRA